jgi:hypothetical protein
MGDDRTVRTVRGRVRVTAIRRALGLPLALIACQLWTPPAFAQDEPRPAAPSLPGAPEEDEGPPSATKVLEDRLAELEERLRLAEEARRPVSPLSFNGYLDFGFFVPVGNHGVGWIRDAGNQQFPQYAPGTATPYTWTFLGDILATTVNTRGDVADLGDGSGITRYDSVHSGGAPGFLLNEFNLRPRFQLTDRAILRASVNFIPRSGENFNLGDIIEMDLGEVEYLVTGDGKTSVFAGKILPVFGIEYKERKADQRFGITPSLIGRYTMGPQLGVKVRSKLLQDWLILAASVTNNSSTIESFHFYSEVDKNAGKTLNGRAAFSLPVGRLWSADDRLEIGLSGEWGPQDRASDNAGKMWFAGADLQFLGTGYALKAQVMQGHAPGRADELVWGLDLKRSGYVEADWQFLPFLGAYAQLSQRDAIVTLGSDRIYITKERRYTGGLRVVMAPNIVLKAEYLFNQEYGGISEFRNDVFTSSLVLSF